jgi:CheY-like chemotaxis protein
MNYCYGITKDIAKPEDEVRNRIMAVDDEQDIIVTLKVGLENGGPFDVYTFTDGKSALRSFKPNFYALILIDIRMPHMSGFELYAELKKIDPNIKVCFLTATEMYYGCVREKDHSDLRDEMFIQKPITTDNLIMRINEKINSTQ